MADQQIKQMLMAYVLLLSKCGPESRGLLPNDLDSACENFLVKDFNHAIDFEVGEGRAGGRAGGLLQGAKGKGADEEGACWDATARKQLDSQPACMQLRIS